MSHRATNWAVEQRGIKPAAKVVLWHLADRHNPDKGGAFPSQDRLAHDCEMSRSALNENLKSLEEAGLIRRIRSRDRKTNKQLPTRYLLGFEFGDGPQDVVEPCPESGHGIDPKTVSGSAEKPCPDSSESRVRNPDSNPVREPVREPVNEREGAGARADGDGEGTQDVDRGSATSDARKLTDQTDRADTPGTADFAKRVQRLCAGTGYLTGRWPDWDQVTIGYLEKQFAALTSEERLEMERWRDPVLADFEARKRKPPPLGPFMAHKQWEALEPAILDRFERTRAARLPAAERPKPDGWAACMGPVGMAWLFDKLLAGPAEDPGEQPLFVASLLRRHWPAVAEWQAIQQQRGGIVFGPRWHALKDAMEAVPQGEVLDAWRAAFKARHWPWPSAFDKGEVVYCPKGGPDGLGEFKRRLGAASNEPSSGESGKPLSEGEALKGGDHESTQEAAE